MSKKIAKIATLALITLFVFSAAVVSVSPASAAFDWRTLFLLSRLNDDDSNGILNSGGTTLGDLFILQQLFPSLSEAAPEPAPVTVTPAVTVSLARRLSGRILLQVQANGEAWYVNPVNTQRYYLGKPAQAFNIMSSLSLGITRATFDSYQGVAPASLAGRFLLVTDDSGKLYYVNPANRSLVFVSGPAGALDLIEDFGLGITNADLAKISVAATSVPVP